jgi:hypothetical protein
LPHKHIAMKSRKIITILFITVFFFGKGFSQTLNNPNFALKSHETLEIRKIVTNDKGTTFWMSVENRIQGGTFCADKKIYFSYPDGSRSQLLSSNGIPVCPDSYKFKSPGERLDFLLVFPALKPGTEWIDLVEDCSDNCFSFYGLVIDNALNSKIDDAFALAEKNEPAGAMAAFIKIAEEPGKMNSGITPLLYINIIKLSRETGSSVRAAEWYNRLKASGAPWAERYIKFLNSQGIVY